MTRKECIFHLVFNEINNKQKQINDTIDISHQNKTHSVFYYTEWAFSYSIYAFIFPQRFLQSLLHLPTSHFHLYSHRRFVSSLLQGHEHPLHVLRHLLHLLNYILQSYIHLPSLMSLLLLIAAYKDARMVYSLLITLIRLLREPCTTTIKDDIVVKLNRLLLFFLLFQSIFFYHFKKYFCMSTKNI